MGMLTSASSVATSTRLLMEKDIISQQENHYLVNDRLFDIWLRKKFISS